ncbi:MAG: 4a-hydroxytetrahydrobiopterin dehydratase [Bacteroidetes bacterium]|nr:4a-hydroxytetrahydrobiopterin dehydratase [Bacteroidota bacterium]
MQDWKTDNNRLVKTCTFRSFEEAMAFMAAATPEITVLDHHPKWTNEYNLVHIELCTHSAGNRITEKDHELAKKLDAVLTRFH